MYSIEELKEMERQEAKIDFWGKILYFIFAPLRILGQERQDKVVDYFLDLIV